MARSWLLRTARAAASFHSQRRGRALAAIGLLAVAAIFARTAAARSPSAYTTYPGLTFSVVPSLRDVARPPESLAAGPAFSSDAGETPQSFVTTRDDTGPARAVSTSTGLLVKRRAFDARLIGVVLGAFLAILTLGSGLGWAASRFTGISAPLAVGGALALLDGLAIVGVCSGHPPAVGPWLQLASFVLASSIMHRPLTRWVAARSGPSLVSGTRGLSTVEYTVLFVVIVAGSLALWRKLSTSLHDQVSTGQAELVRAMSSANAKGNEPVSPEAPSNAPKEPGASNGPSAVVSGPGMSPPSAANPPAHTGSSIGQPGHAPPPTSIHTGAPVAPAHLPAASGGPRPSGSTMTRPHAPPPDPVVKKPKRTTQTPDETAKPQQPPTEAVGGGPEKAADARAKPR